MANLRILADNVADTAVLAASSSAGALVASNLQDDERAAVWRSVGTSATLTATWGDSQFVDSVVLGWSNLTALATVTVRAFAEVADAAPVAELTTTVDSARPLGEFAWGLAPLVQPSAGEGGVPQSAQVWLPGIALAKKVEVEIADPSNPAGYLQAARLSIGMRHEVRHNPSYGIRLRIVDAAKTSRAESQALRIEPQGTYRALEMDFSYLREADVHFFQSLAARGKRPIFVSVFPDSQDARRHAYAMFCAPAAAHESAYQYLATWSQGLSLEEIA